MLFDVNSSAFWVWFQLDALGLSLVLFLNLSGLFAWHGLYGTMCCDVSSGRIFCAIILCDRLADVNDVGGVVISPIFVDLQVVGRCPS